MGLGLGAGMVGMGLGWGADGGRGEVRMEVGMGGWACGQNTGTMTQRGKQLETRHSLLRRLKHLDDQVSWEEFFNQYSKLIYTLALKAGLTPPEAQDVVQETMATVARKIKDFEVGAHRGSFKSWLLQTTRWRIADQFSRRPPSAAHLSGEQDQTPHTPTTERLPDPASLELNAVWDEEWRDNLRKIALANLRTQIDPIKYQMFDLHVLKGLPGRVVARKLGVKLNKIYYAKYKVARLLKKKMKELEAKLI